jgi:hypothetical protein
MNILQVVLPVFLIIAVGAFLGKIKKLNLDPFIFILVYITAPSLIISALQKTDIRITEFLPMIFYTLIIVLSLALISTLIIKLSKTKQKGIQLPMIFGNTGYLGYPIALLAFGTVGLSYAVIYSSIETIIMMSLGIYLANKKNNFKEMFKVPLIYAVIIALFLNTINYKLPIALLTPIDMIGQITIPLALIILGYRLTEIRLRSLNKALLAALFKMGIGLIIAIALVAIFSLTGIPKNILILQAAMPSAVFTMILAHKYKRDSDLVASIVLLSTLFSLITIPLILWFLA